jgi:predicted nucleotidyltransferase
VYPDTSLPAAGGFARPLAGDAGYRRWPRHHRFQQRILSKFLLKSYICENSKRRRRNAGRRNNMIQDYIDEIKRVVLSELAEEHVAIALFGSAATGASTYASDIDIAVVPYGTLNCAILSQLRERVEELSVPYVIDIVDFSMVSDFFKKTALIHAVWWRK